MPRMKAILLSVSCALPELLMKADGTTCLVFGFQGHPGVYLFHPRPLLAKECIYTRILLHGFCYPSARDQGSNLLVST